MDAGKKVAFRRALSGTYRRCLDYTCRAGWHGRMYCPQGYGPWDQHRHPTAVRTPGSHKVSWVIWVKRPLYNAMARQLCSNCPYTDPVYSTKTCVSHYTRKIRTKKTFLASKGTTSNSRTVHWPLVVMNAGNCALTPPIRLDVTVSHQLYH
jgi:hypothetical protein